MLRCLLLLIAATPVIAQDDPVFSGPQVGEDLVPFKMIPPGAERGNEEIDLLANAGDKPVVVIFLHEQTRPGFSLGRAIINLVADRGPEKLVGSMVYLDDDPTAANTWLSNIKNYFPPKAIIGYSPDGKEGPGAYGLNRNVSVTVLIGVKKKVTANFALVQPSMQTDAPKIFKAIADVLGEEEVPNVEDFSSMSRRRGSDERMKRDTNDGDPVLQMQFKQLVNKGNSDEAVVEIAKRLERYVEVKPETKALVGQRARSLVESGRLKDVGTKKCQEFITKWAKEFKASASEDKSADKADSKSPSKD